MSWKWLNRPESFGEYSNEKFFILNQNDNLTRVLICYIHNRCPITHHDGSDPAKYFPRVITSPEEAAQIAALHASSQVQSTPLDNHYICYANQQKTARNAVLGYGVHVVNSRLGTLSSPCEYLSLDSYKNSGIRRSSTNLPFEHWLPILVNMPYFTLSKRNGYKNGRQ